jgi:ABC-type transport system involved in multi-copper enzyme maturation permease subunit
MISKSLVKYVLTAAMRDRLMITLALMMLLSAAVAAFASAASVTEGSSFALVFGAGAMRFVGVLGVVLFCCFYIRRSFETKEVEFLLSRPISRLTFLFSHASAFAILAAVVALGAMIAVFIVGKPAFSGLLLWGVSLFVEFSIIAAAALFFSMVLSSAAGSALATLGLYALARMTGVLLGILDLPPANMFFALIGGMMKVISILIPRLDMMGQTAWLVYGAEGAGDAVKFLPNASSYAYWLLEHLGVIGFIGLQGVIFIALLLAAAAHDFMKREF